MLRLRRKQAPPEGPPPRGELPTRLPQRWALIVAISASVSGGAALAGGPLAAVLTGLVVAKTLDSLIE